MKVVRLDRFTVDPADAAQMLARREQLVAAVRDVVPGLIETRLARIDDRHWIDMWYWESRERAQAAVARAQAGDIPQAGAAFALTRDHITEFADVVEER